MSSTWTRWGAMQQAGRNVLATSVQSPGLITSVQAGTTSKSRQRAACNSPESFEILPTAAILLPYEWGRQRKIAVLLQKYQLSAGVPAVSAPTCLFAILVG